jgi:hypothetical protein
VRKVPVDASLIAGATAPHSPLVVLRLLAQRVEPAMAIAAARVRGLAPDRLGHGRASGEPEQPVAWPLEPTIPADAPHRKSASPGAMQNASSRAAKSAAS